MPVSSAGSCLRLELDAELVQLFRRQVARRSRHVVVADLVLREGLCVANPFLGKQGHEQAVYPRSDASVRRRAHRQRVEQESELLPLLLGADAEIGEHLLLQLRLVDTEGASCELDAVADELVRNRARPRWIGLEELNSVIGRPCEGMVWRMPST